MPLLTLVVLAALLVGVVIYGRGIEVPGLVGLLNDDAFYAFAAKQLAAGHGYFEVTPAGTLPLTRYPIGFPALLALTLPGTHDVAEQIARMQWVPPFSAALYVLACFVWFWRQTGGRWLPALAGTAWIATQPVVLLGSGDLMSDFAFAVALIASVCVLQALLEGDRPTWAFVGAGILVGLACLIRYAGLALVVAVVVVGAARLRPGQLLRLAVGVALPVVPWLVFRALAGGDTYVGEFGHQLSGTPGAALGLLAESARSMFLASLPGLLAPRAIASPGAWTVPLALLLDLVLLVGLAAWLARGGRRQAEVAPWVAAVTLPLILVWDMAYTSMGAGLTSRLLVPVAPFLVYAAARLAPSLATRTGLPTRVGRAIAAVVVVAAIGAECVQMGGYWLEARAGNQKVVQRANYPQLFAAIRRLVEPGAVMLGWHGRMLQLYTDHPCLTLPAAPGVDDLHALIVANHVRYLIGTPMLDADAARPYVLAPTYQPQGRDRSIQLINGYITRYPGSLTPVWVNPSHTYVIFRVETGVTRPQAS